MSDVKPATDAVIAYRNRIAGFGGTNVLTASEWREVAARIAALEEALREWDRLSLVIDSACRNDPRCVSPSLRSEVDAVIRATRALVQP